MNERLGNVPQEIGKAIEFQPKQASISNQLAAFGNNEAKALTLMLMHPGIIHTQDELHNLILEAQRGSELGIGWKSDSKAQMSYCSDSLAPIGLAVKAKMADTGEWGYVLTPEGEKAQGLAALLLDFSIRLTKNNFDISLSDLFGRTGPSPKGTGDGEKIIARAPDARLRIFRKIANSSDNPRQSDLVASTGMDHGLIEKHLLELTRKGVINYKTTEGGKVYTYHSLNPDHPAVDPPGYKKRLTLTQRIYEIFLQQPFGVKLTGEDILAKYKEKFDSENRLESSALRKNIHTVLQHLSKTDYLRQGEFSGQRRTAITVNEEIKKMLKKLVTLVDNFENHDEETLKMAEELLKGLRLDPDACSLLMRKAREHSSHFNARDSDRTKQAILACLNANPNTTTKDIQFDLKEKGINLGISVMMHYLGQLSAEGRVVSARSGKEAIRYSVR